MLETKTVDIYASDKLAVESVTLNCESFDMDSEERQSVTATGFLPDDERFTNESEIVIDFKDGRFARARIISSMRLCDENQCEMRLVDAARSLEDLMLCDEAKVV